MVIGLSTVPECRKLTVSRYVPSRMMQRSPGVSAASTPRWMVRNGRADDPSFESLPPFSHTYTVLGTALARESSDLIDGCSPMSDNGNRVTAMDSCAATSC